MKEIKNISAKVIGIPVSEAGNKPLLPDETLVVDDKVANLPGVKTLVDAGYAKVTAKAGKAPEAPKAVEAPKADAPEAPAADTAKAKKASK